MTLDKRPREQLLAHCGEIHDDDCVDPREFSKTKRDSRKQDRKTQQLCRQVERTLDLVLSDGCHDELFQNLRVQAVEPAPNASNLLVTVCADVPGERFDRQAILDFLAGQASRLRCEVASAITRKRAPTLVFHVVGPTGTDEIGT